MSIENSKNLAAAMLEIEPDAVPGELIRRFDITLRQFDKLVGVLVPFVAKTFAEEMVGITNDLQASTQPNTEAKV